MIGSEAGTVLQESAAVSIIASEFRVYAASISFRARALLRSLPLFLAPLRLSAFALNPTLPSADMFAVSLTPRFSGVTSASA